MTDYYSGNGGAEANGYSQGPGPGRDDDKKIFVGGLGWQTTVEAVQEYFGQYGEVTNVNLKVDGETGRSRGFCFVTFAQSEPVQQVLATPDHQINGRRVEAKVIKSRQTKLFVGGLKPEMSDEAVRQHFDTFGKVAQLDMPMDRVKNQRKGFCFVTFENENDVRQLIKTGKTTIDGVEVGVKKATPRAGPGAVGGGPGAGGMGDPGAAAGGYNYGGGGYGYGSGGGYGGGYDDGYGGYGGGYDDGYGGAGYDDGYGYGGGYDDGYGGGYGAAAGGGGYGAAAGGGGGYGAAGGGGYGGGNGAAAAGGGYGYKPPGRGAAAAVGRGGGGAGGFGAAPGAGRGGAVRGARGARGRARPQPY